MRVTISARSSPQVKGSSKDGSACNLFASPSRLTLSYTNKASSWAAGKGDIMIGRRTFLSGLLAAAASPHSAVKAEENDFAGKTITYIVSTKPGGGYDTMGRLVAKYLEAHIPGVRVIVKNVPGAGHMVGCQTIYSAAPDGLTLGTFNTGLLYSQLAGVLDSTLDLGKMSWIGKAAVESRVIVVAAKSDIARIDDLKKPGRVFKVGVNAKGGTAHVDSMLLAQAFSYNFKQIFGFEGTDAELSLLRGEIDLIMASRSSLEGFVANGNGRFLIEYGGEPGSNLPRGDSLAQSEAEKSTVALIVSTASLARATAGPPGIPAERLQVLRDAYRAAFADPALLAEAKTLGLPIMPASGEEVAERVKLALSPSSQIRTMIAQVLK
jgi:tripartite-type tricarboxylate transporter receptor subunit TctC